MKTSAVFISLLLVSCTNTAVHPTDKETIKQEVLAAEKAFCEEAKQNGIANAFYLYADSMATIKRLHDTLITGREAIRKYYTDPKYTNAEVSWTPDFVEVSDDGTLGYTYGNYTWTMHDTSGEAVNYTGVFHTVWKKQKDGSWKYVWD